MTILAPAPMATDIVGVLTDLATCVCNELSTVGAGPMCWCGLMPGEGASWDYCGSCDGESCGMGWVRLASVFPYDQFPYLASDTFHCWLPIAWSIEVGALRCMPTPKDEYYSAAELNEVVANQALDAAALYKALRCCNVATIAPQTYTPVGPQGGCVGGTWTATLTVE